MKGPLKSAMIYSIERSVVRIPQNVSHDPTAGDSVSGFRNIKSVSVERNERTPIGKCITDIRLSLGSGAVDSVIGVSYTHKIENETIIDFGGTPDDLKASQLARVAFNLSGLSRRLQSHSVST